MDTLAAWGFIIFIGLVWLLIDWDTRRKTGRRLTRRRVTLTILLGVFGLALDNALERRKHGPTSPH